MSFRLKELLKLFDNSGTDCDGIARGHGAVTLVAFYTCLGISEPTTADLTENMIIVFQKHLRSELPPPIAESYLLDAQTWLRFIYDNGWCAHDWSYAIKIIKEHITVIPLIRRKANAS